MSKKSLTTSSGVAALALALSTMPAWAGFEWVAPQEAPVYQQPTYQQPSPSVPPMSAAISSPEVISPVIISGTAPTPTAPPVQTSPTYASRIPAPVASSPPPAAQPVSNGAPLNLATATIAMPSSAGNDIVQGFASQVPLALALRQILPVNYSFSIDQNVDMNMLVSYKGGKPWRDTLGELLASAGLVFHEQGSTIEVSAMANASASYVPAPPPAYAPPSYTPPARPSMMDTAGMSNPSLPAVNVGSPDGWSAQRGDTLRKVLTAWCARSGVELQWLAEYDYPMEASSHFNGDFESAVRDLLAGFGNARPQPVAELHTNANAGQKLLVVQARGNSYSN